MPSKKTFGASTNPPLEYVHPTSVPINISATSPPVLINPISCNVNHRAAVTKSSPTIAPTPVPLNPQASTINTPPVPTSHIPAIAHPPPFSTYPPQASSNPPPAMWPVGFDLAELTKTLGTLTGLLQKVSADDDSDKENASYNGEILPILLLIYCCILNYYIFLVILILIRTIASTQKGSYKRR